MVLPMFMSLLFRGECEVQLLHEIMLQCTKDSWKHLFHFDKRNSSKDNWGGVELAREQTEGLLRGLQEGKKAAPLNV